MNTKIPEVIPRSCGECKYYKPTNSIFRGTGDCQFYNQNRYANWECIAKDPSFKEEPESRKINTSDNCGASKESETDIILNRYSNSPEYQKVIVMDVKMPFNSMVGFMIKWAIASIPAFIILAVIGLIISLFFSPFF